MKEFYRSVNINGPERLIAAEHLRRKTYAVSNMDVEAMISVQRFFVEAGFPDMASDKSTVLNALHTAKWAHCGFPVVRVGHRLAASLMATRLTIDMKPFIVPPWGAFEIHLPEPLPITKQDGTVAPGEIVAAMWFDSFNFPGKDLKTGISISLRSSVDGLNLYSHSPVEFILEEEEKKIKDGDDPFHLPSTSSDERSLLLATRLVMGVCLELSDPRTLSQSQRGKSHNKTHRSGDPPEPRVYELNRSVKLDVRDSIRGFIQGTNRSTVTVQSLVRGHWKQQVHGHGRSDRKLIHVEPYWRGPELSPVNAKVQ